MEEENYKIYIKVPKKWFDLGSPIGWASPMILREARNAIEDAVLKQFITKVTLPTFEFSDAEIREAVKDKLVDEIIIKGKKD